jgi:XTP/dITP diphosphohydrolase
LSLFFFILSIHTTISLSLFSSFSLLFSHNVFFFCIFARMKTLIFATNNSHKLQEVKQMLNGIVEIKSLADIHLSGDIPETADTLEGNALQKAQWVLERSGMDCFADDTGLEVKALGGRPGVYTARYAGDHCTFDDNINKMLAEMQGETDRSACFRTVICLLQGDSQRFFEGRVDGTILTERQGVEGFGYDPIFMPERFAVSFAEMPMEVKNRISHRGLAVAKLVEYLKNDVLSSSLK